MPLATKRKYTGKGPNISVPQVQYTEAEIMEIQLCTWLSIEPALSCSWKLTLNYRNDRREL